MPNLKRKSIILFLCINFGYGVIAQTEDIVTPLFNLTEVKDVVSMYTDETAQTFYLHTDSILYTVSREGVILSIEKSPVKYGCVEKNVLYTHEEYSDIILNQAGDTVLAVPSGGWDTEDSFYLQEVRWLFREKGVFYVWFGATRDGGWRSDAFFSITTDNVKLLKFCHHPCRGLVLLDGVFLFTYLGYSDGDLYPGHFGIFSLIDESLSIKKSWPFFGLNLPVGLSLIGDTLYTWSDATQTMYRIPCSCFDDVIAGFLSQTVRPSVHTAYDLSGRSEDGTQKGIFIRNGKKVLVR